MGVLRIKENVEELLEKDPYELFSIEEPHQIARRMRPEFWGAAFVGLLVAFGVALMTFLNVQKDAKDAGDTPFVYFEIKAIDPDGHPVAGAVVREGTRQLGVTDSFGEWRRFMRVKLGTTMTFEIGKKAGAGALTAVKNIAVPTRLPGSGDLELTGSVQLARAALRGVPASRSERRPADAASMPVEKARQLESDMSDDEATTYVSGALAAAPSSIWFMADAGSRPELAEVVQALRRRSLELGMRVDPASPLRVSVRDFLVARQTSERAERRLIVVEARDVHDIQAMGESRLFTYMRDYQETSVKTARDILWAATVHMAVPHRVTQTGSGWRVESDGPALWQLSPGRELLNAAGERFQIAEAIPGSGQLMLAPSDATPCGETSCTLTTPGIRNMPPVAGWQRLQMTVLGADPTTDLYVAGYEAQKVEGKTYAYWGQPNVGVNVTAFRGGRLVLRGRVEPSVTGVPTVSVPALTVSRRQTP